MKLHLYPIIDPRGVYHSFSHAVRSLGGGDQHVVISNFESSWIVTPSSADAINIEYEVAAEPGGAIPSWLYNLAVEKGPITTMINLKNLLEMDVRSKP